MEAGRSPWRVGAVGALAEPERHLSGDGSIPEGAPPDEDEAEGKAGNDGHAEGDEGPGVVVIAVAGIGANDAGVALNGQEPHSNGQDDAQQGPSQGTPDDYCDGSGPAHDRIVRRCDLDRQHLSVGGGVGTEAG